MRVVCSTQIAPKSELSPLIRKLEIENFRCFAKIAIEDARRFTVITGPNASGKTTLLEAIFLAGGNTAEIYLRTSIWRGREDFPIPTAPTHLISLLEDYFHQFDINKTLRVWFQDNHGEEREIRLGPGTDEVLSLPFEPTKSSEAISSKPANLKFFWKTPKGELEARPEASPEGLKLKRPDDAYFMVFLNTATVGGAKETADRYSELSRANRESPIVEAVRKIFPYVTDLSVLSPGGISAIHAAVRGLDRKIPLGLLSSGINKFVSVLAAICSAPGSAVLVDEIENGWYYAKYREMWQEIIAVAEDRNTQMFVTTHSREFLEAISPLVERDVKNYRLIRVEKSNGASTIKEFSGREFSSAISSGVDVR